jgi:hypothetical protein
MAAAPLPAYGSFENTRLKALQLKRKVGGEREEDGELTKTKKDSNPPASPDDEQPRLLRVSSRLSSVASNLTRILDGKREEGTHGYIFIDLVYRVRLGSPKIPD